MEYIVYSGIIHVCFWQIPPAINYTGKHQKSNTVPYVFLFASNNQFILKNKICLNKLLHV